MLAEPTGAPIVETPGPLSTKLSIRLADSNDHRNQANFLVHKMYGRRGYSNAALPADPRRLTLVALSTKRAVATITVGLDGLADMRAVGLYPEQIAGLRRSGARLCEFTRFAVDRSRHSLNLLAMMFHVAYLFARRHFDATHIVAEVNPRHVRFYEGMLGFEVIGPERLCPRVGAPAVLLKLSLDWGEAQIARYGGRPDLARSMRSLYPLAFSPQEEAAIAARLFNDDSVVAMKRRYSSIRATDGIGCGSAGEQA